jgi:hypothetical protein
MERLKMHHYKIKGQFAFISGFVASWLKDRSPLNALFVFCALSIVFPMIVTAATSEEDFALRCAATGVVNCVGFDNTTADIVEGVNLWPDGGGTVRGGLDTSLKASGNGSLRFNIPPPPHSGGDIAGRWMPSTGQGAPTYAFGGNKFSLGDTFHLQYRTRMDQNYINNSTTGSWTKQWKNIILHGGTASCSPIELTTIRKNTDNLVWAIYDSCGRGIGTGENDLNFKLWNGAESLQNSDFDCLYNGPYAEPDCFLFTANEWMTFYWKVQISSGWGVADGKIEVWVSTESSPSYRKLFEVNQWPSAGAGTAGYDNLTLTTYMTNLPTTDGLAGITSRLWYDELIVSTQPINAPNSSVPLPPTNLTIQ